MKKLTDLTPEEKRVLIAETCGWTKCDKMGCKCDLWMPPGESFWRPATVLSKYLNDLNATHEMEAMFAACEIKWHEYKRNLILLIEPHRHEINATAAQRSDAFLLTMKLAEL